MQILKANAITKSFGGLTAVNDVDFHIDEGEIVGLIGPNGAGKTTFFNIITGVYEPTSGEVIFLDEAINGLKPHEIATKGISRDRKSVV